MGDHSNMSRIEAMFYDMIEALGVKMSGKLRRLDEPLASGAEKEWVVKLTFPDETVKTVTVPYDLDAYSTILKHAKGEL